jgi:cysteine-S-conjugate beta-lyase
MSQGPTYETTVARLREAGSLKWTQYPDAIGAFVAEMDFGTAPSVALALNEAVDRALLGYLTPGLEERLAQAWCRFAKERYDWDVAPERVRPLADVAAGLQAAIEQFCEPGTPVILPTPAYMPFLFMRAELGREVIEVPMALEQGRYVYDLDALDRAFAAGGNLLVLCNPHNPIGRVLETAEMEGIAQVVERHGGRVFSDEIHAPLVYDGHRHVPYASLSALTAGHTVTAVSASKAWNLPGTKCAQLVLSNDRDAETWARVGRRYEHGASTLGVVAGIAAYEDGGPWLGQVLGHLDGNRRLLAELLADRAPQVGYTPPEGTYLAWLDLRETGLGEHPAEALLERAQVAVIDGPACGRAGSGFVRYNFATPRPVLEETVDRIVKVLHRSSTTTKADAR